MAAIEYKAGIKTPGWDEPRLDQIIKGNVMIRKPLASTRQPISNLLLLYAISYLFI